MEKNCDMHEGIEEISRNVKEIKDALLGNIYNNNQGIIHKVENHEKQLKQLKGKLIFLSGAFSVLSFIAGYIFDKIFK